MEKDNKTMLKKRKTYLKPSVNAFINGDEHFWPMGVAAAKALGFAAGVGLALFGPKKHITPRPDGLQKQ